MLMTIAIAGAGFVVGVVFAAFVPLGLYVRRLMFWLRGPVPFKLGDETYSLGPDDAVHWNVSEKRRATRADVTPSPPPSINKNAATGYWSAPQK